MSHFASFPRILVRLAPPPGERRAVAPRDASATDKPTVRHGLLAVRRRLATLVGRGGSPVGALGFRPGLDGVRALAVASVLIAHVATPDMELPVRLPGSPWIGVDVFFVLSGFLITRILIDEQRRNGTIDLARFWARRALRLMPLSIAVVASVGALAFLFGDPFYHSGADVSPRRAILATLGYHMNWLQASPSTHHIWALTPTWSLSLEEQFYVVWPALLYACHRLLRRRFEESVGVAAGAILVASAVARYALFRQGAMDHVYNGLDTRAGQLCIGGLLASVSVVAPRLMELAGRFGWLGLCAVLTVMLRWSVDNRFYGLGYDVIGVFSFVLVAGAYRTGSSLGRLLGHPVMCWIGIRAYSLYLVHYPLFLLMTRGHVPLPPSVLMTLRLVAAFVVADVAYRHVE